MLYFLDSMNHCDSEVLGVNRQFYHEGKIALYFFCDPYNHPQQICNRWNKTQILTL